MKKVKSKMPLETRRPAGPAIIFPPRRDYVSLSVRDLLDAREAYHVFLSSLENVVATAIGRYFIKEDDWFAQQPPDRPRPPGFPVPQGPRTLANSVIRPWSWPCVLVFVKQWAEAATLGSNEIPRALHLPDGRVAPTCVIEAAPDESLPAPAAGPFQSAPLLGGGYTCIRNHQGEQNVGTFSCLVKKAGSYYVLTSRHVAGGEGEQVKAFVRGGFVPVATSTSIAVDRVLLPTVFPSWPYSRTLLTMDAGLARIKDINDWTSQAFGIGEIGDVFDATEASLTLDLIGLPVRAFGGTSGVSEGEIQALFFRFESLGGYEYVTDVLVGPRRLEGHRTTKPLTRPGDSGALWFYDPPIPQPTDAADQPKQVDMVQRAEGGTRARRLRPIAMQWGGQRILLPGDVPTSYALASFLSSVCRSLDVEVIRNWSLGHDEYWGKIGHFAIGWKACDLLSGTLSKLMTLNQSRIGFGDKTLEAGAGLKVNPHNFVPLADVPDYVWVVSKGSHPNEGIQHFADIDIKDINGGPSLLEVCFNNPSKVAASIWKEYFDGFAAEGVGPDEGALPFRVWQIWDAMAHYLKKNDVLRFVAAAGVLAHYVGDASQPLHCSYMHHGIPPMITRNGGKYPVRKESPEFKKFKTSSESKIHGIYEETMLEVDTAAVLAGVNAALNSNDMVDFDIRSGHDAAVAIIKLMHDSQARLSPEMIIKADNPALGPKARAKALWQNKKIRDGTILSLAESVNLLAALWSSAWRSGKGEKISKSRIIELDESALDHVYRRDRKFVPSLGLEEMVKSGKFEPS
jgi:hypothetical protein